MSYILLTVKILIVQLIVLEDYTALSLSPYEYHRQGYYTPSYSNNHRGTFHSEEEESLEPAESKAFFKSFSYRTNSQANNQGGGGGGFSSASGGGKEISGGNVWSEQSGGGGGEGFSQGQVNGGSWSSFSVGTNYQASGGGGSFSKGKFAQQGRSRGEAGWTGVSSGGGGFEGGGGSYSKGKFIQQGRSGGDTGSVGGSFRIGGSFSKGKYIQGQGRGEARTASFIPADGGYTNIGGGSYTQKIGGTNELDSVKVVENSQKFSGGFSGQAEYNGGGAGGAGSDIKTADSFSQTGYSEGAAGGRGYVNSGQNNAGGFAYSYSKKGGGGGGYYSSGQAAADVEDVTNSYMRVITSFQGMSDSIFDMFRNITLAGQTVANKMNAKKGSKSFEGEARTAFGGGYSAAAGAAGGAASTMEGRSYGWNQGQAQQQPGYQWQYSWSKGKG